MNNTSISTWSGLSASIPGYGHIRRGLPCQDASATVQTPRPALIVCDGRGSASRSQDGAAGAVRAFKTQCAIFEPMLASILDADTPVSGQWAMFCRILYRTLRQVQVDLASKHKIPEEEFDFTVAAVVIGKRWNGCFQVGDGAIVLRQNGIPVTAFPPDKGEFANQTHFLRENGEACGRYHGKLFSASDNSGIAVTSDGPEYLMFRLRDMLPGPIFTSFFDRMQNTNLTKQDIMDYLTRHEWDNDPRGYDDRSIAIMVPVHSRSVLNAKETLIAVHKKRNGLKNGSPPESHIPFSAPTPSNESVACFNQMRGTVSDLDLEHSQDVEPEADLGSMLGNASAQDGEHSVGIEPVANLELVHATDSVPDLGPMQSVKPVETATAPEAESVSDIECVPEITSMSDLNPMQCVEPVAEPDSVPDFKQMHGVESAVDLRGVPGTDSVPGLGPMPEAESTSGLGEVSLSSLDPKGDDIHCRISWRKFKKGIGYISKGGMQKKKRISNN